jgi:hypothetical protein
MSVSDEAGMGFYSMTLVSPRAVLDEGVVNLCGGVYEGLKKTCYQRFSLPPTVAPVCFSMCF